MPILKVVNQYAVADQTNNYLVTNALIESIVQHTYIENIFNQRGGASLVTCHGWLHLWHRNFFDILQPICYQWKPD